MAHKLAVIIQFDLANFRVTLFNILAFDQIAYFLKPWLAILNGINLSRNLLEYQIVHMPEPICRILNTSISIIISNSSIAE